MTPLTSKLTVRTPGFEGRVGFSRKDITPPVGIRNRNWGAAKSDVATGVHRPFDLSVLALAGADNSSLVLLVGVDGTHWRAVEDWTRLQSRVLEELGLDISQLLVNLSHTHSGPVLTARHADLPGGEFLENYLDDLSGAVAQAGREAIADLSDGTIEWSRGSSAIAVNRDLDLDGRALVGYNPDIAADDTILIGRVSHSDGSTLATVVNYACHPTTLAWDNSKLSPDYIGELREVIEQKTGAPCLFLQGASGDLSPRLQYSGDTALADKHGRAIGLATLAALETLPPSSTDLCLSATVESGAPLAIWSAEKRRGSPILQHTTGVSHIPLRPLATEAQLEKDWAGILPQSRDERLRRVRDLREGYIDLDQNPDSVAHPFWVARLGDALLVAHAGEAYSWFQRELRARFPDHPVLVLNLTNGPGFVYIPDRSAYERDAYQAWQTVFAPGSLEHFTDDVSSALRDLLDETGCDEPRTKPCR